MVLRVSAADGLRLEAVLADPNGPHEMLVKKLLEGASGTPVSAARGLPIKANPLAFTEYWADLVAAKAADIRLGILKQIWKLHGFNPDGARHFEDPHWAAKICAIVDLYLHPPADGVVLPTDEKGQIPVVRRARSKASLTEDGPVSVVDGQRLHGTTNLFAALNVLTGRSHRPLHAAAAAPGIPPFPQRP